MSDADDADNANDNATRSVNIFDEQTRVVPSHTKAAEPKQNIPQEPVPRIRTAPLTHYQAQEPITTKEVFSFKDFRIPHISKANVAVGATLLTIVVVLVRLFSSSHAQPVIVSEEPKEPTKTVSRPMAPIIIRSVATDDGTVPIVQNLTSTSFLAHFRTAVEINQNFGRDPTWR